MFPLVKHKLKTVFTCSILLLLQGCGGSNEGMEVTIDSPGGGELLHKIDVELSQFEPTRYWCDSIQFLDGLIYMNVRSDDNLESCSGSMEYVGTYTRGEEGEYLLSLEDSEFEPSLFIHSSDSRALDAELLTDDGLESWVLYRNAIDAEFALEIKGQQRTLGLQVGDIVLSINGRMLGEMSSLSFAELFTGICRNELSVELQIQRGDSIFNVNVPCF